MKVNRATLSEFIAGLIRGGATDIALDLLPSGGGQLRWQYPGEPECSLALEMQDLEELCQPSGS